MFKDVNANGLQESSDLNMVGIVVQLLDSTGALLVFGFASLEGFFA